MDFKELYQDIWRDVVADTAAVNERTQEKKPDWLIGPAANLLSGIDSSKVVKDASIAAEDAKVRRRINKEGHNFDELKLDPKSRLTLVGLNNAIAAADKAEKQKSHELGRDLITLQQEPELTLARGNTKASLASTASNERVSMAELLSNEKIAAADNLARLQQAQDADNRAQQMWLNKVAYLDRVDERDYARANQANFSKAIGGLLEMIFT